ncbi:MAG: type II toxin-antitoxin system RatA family toxin [Burkholderiaceae bacterium]
MTTITRSALVPYSDRQMFDLVADVERYPQFLPWCGGTQVLEQSEGRQVATITIAFKGIRQAFTTENTLEPPQRIVLTLRDGPFSHLDGEWRFKALRPDACRIDFKLEYAMRSGLLARLLGPIFGQIAQTMVDAFVKRAAALAGD